jgi:hypothetical protein
MPKRDPKFVEQIRNLRCLACGSWPSEAHHVKSRGAGGGDDWFNLLPLCQGCHTQNGDGYAWHRGKILFLKNHPHVLEHLQKLGWELIGDKLIRSQVDK